MRRRSAGTPPHSLLRVRTNAEHERASLHVHEERRDHTRTCQRVDTLLDARSTRVVQADDGRTHLHRLVHDLADLLGIGLRQTASVHGEVLCTAGAAAERQRRGESDTQLQPPWPGPRTHPCKMQAGSGTAVNAVYMKFDSEWRRARAGQTQQRRADVEGSLIERPRITVPAWCDHPGAPN
jgi:hypothetical protein